MYGLGFGPTQARTSSFQSGQYDVVAGGRTVSNPVVRTGGVPMARESVWQFMGSPAPAAVPISAPVPVALDPVTVISSSGVPKAQTLPYVVPDHVAGAGPDLNDWLNNPSTVPWYVWAALAAGAWWMFGGKRGRR